MKAIELSNAIARRYFLHASDTNDDGTRCCYFGQELLNEDGWGFWVEPNGTVVRDETSANGKLPSPRIVDACVRAAVKFLGR